MSPLLEATQCCSFVRWAFASFAGCLPAFLPCGPWMELIVGSASSPSVFFWPFIYFSWRRRMNTPLVAGIQRGKGMHVQLGPLGRIRIDFEFGDNLVHSSEWFHYELFGRPQLQLPKKNNPVGRVLLNVVERCIQRGNFVFGQWRSFFQGAAKPHMVASVENQRLAVGKVRHMHQVIPFGVSATSSWRLPRWSRGTGDGFRG